MKNYWDNKNVLVTGGTGFIGTWLSKELLKNRANLSCLTKQIPGNDTNFCKLELLEKTKIIVRDLSSIEPEVIQEDLEENNISAVFHLAGQPILSKATANPYDTIKLNVLGASKVLEACRKCGKIESIVISSSINAYGGNGIHACNEEDPLRGIFPYEVSMTSLDLIAQSYAYTFNLPIGVARFSNVYGPGDLNFERLIPRTIKRILNNEEIELTNNGKTQRGFLYVTDAAAGLMYLSQYIDICEKKGEVFNFGPENTCNILDIVKKIIEYSKLKYDGLILKEDCPTKERIDQYLDITKAREVLGWIPQVSLEQGIEKTFEWYKQNQ